MSDFMANKAKVVMLMAVSTDGLIGRNGTLPWNLPNDLAHFKDTTSGEGKVLVMGYNTWKSLPEGKVSGEKLAGRKKIVLTKKELLPMKDTVFLNDDSMVNNGARLDQLGFHTAYVIGGSSLFNTFKYSASELIITRVPMSFTSEPGDTRIDLNSMLRTFPYRLSEDKYLADPGGQLIVQHLGIESVNEAARTHPEPRTINATWTMDPGELQF